MSKPELLRRREALAALGALGLAGAIPRLRSLTIDDAEAASCVLMPELTEGPYWVRNNLTRRDITESRPGIPLVLTFKVQDASTCGPIKGADVELWHADNRGVYSGVNGASTHFLRGHQKSNADGVVRFDTIYPRLVPRPHAAHPRQGPRGRRRAHRPDLLPRLRQRARVPHEVLRGARAGRHDERRGLDLRR
jgi:protocatechuate 3,4-dioxygenase beta subunit